MLAISEAAALLGVSRSTLRRWELEGKINKPARTIGNHRRYRLEDVLQFYSNSRDKAPVPLKKKTILYGRVSGSDQKADLERQLERLVDFAESNNYQNIEIVKDLGSGLRTDKRGLKKLIHDIMTLKVDTLILTTEDRLLRFGTELIFSICNYMGVKVVILDAPKNDISDEEQLTQDVIKLMVCFCAKLHGKRSHKNRKNAA